MAKYVLGPGAARQLKEILRGRMTAGRVEGDGACAIDEREYAHPFTLTWAASAGAVDSQTGASAGAWIIWLPEGSLVIDGETVDLTENMTAAASYPAGWFDLTDIFDGDEPGDFDLYVDASKDDPKFVIDPDDAENPVLVASVSGKEVKGVVRSALVFAKGGNKKPFDIETDEVEESGETVTVRKVVRCKFRHYSNDVSLSDFTLPDDPSAADSLMLVWRVALSVTLTDQNIDTYWSLCMESNLPADDPDYVMFAIKLYDFDASGNVTVDYRDADVNSDLGMKDNNTIADNDPSGAGQFNMSLHLKQFYGTGRNLSSAPSDFDVLIRHTPQGADFASLFYLSKAALAAAIGGGGGGGHAGDNDDVAVGGSGGIFAWTAESRTIGPGGCMVGRKWLTCTTGTGSGKADGLYQLKVVITTNGATLEVVSEVSLGTAPNGNVSYIPIYQISNAKISADYRGAFVVPCYE